MENQKIGWVNITFADHVGTSNDAEHILDLIILSWKEIDRVMRSIIGKGGIDALFHRSIESTALAYPWLAAALSDAHPAMDFDALRHALSKQSISVAAVASDGLLLHFHHLLADLVGLSLTERLLRPVLEPLLNGTATKDM